MAKKQYKGNAASGAYKLALGAPFTVIGFTTDLALTSFRFADRNLPDELGIEYGIKASRKFQKATADSTEFAITSVMHELDALAKAVK